MEIVTQLAHPIYRLPNADSVTHMWLLQDGSVACHVLYPNFRRDVIPDRSRNLR